VARHRISPTLCDEDGDDGAGCSLHGGYGENIIHADYTHSLVGALVLSLVFGLMFGMRWGKRCAIVLALVSFSHWVLDLVVHRHDMPILPGDLGNLPKLGFGLWQFKTGAILAELLLVIVVAWCYWPAADGVSTTAQKGRARAIIAATFIFLCGVAVLSLDVTGVIDDIQGSEKVQLMSLALLTITAILSAYA
jgi:membrane-bound metal-dependent hydrolase YbcI (DUF457 family)